MAYRKTFSGDHNANANNELASHNRIIMDTGAGFTIFAVYAITLVTGALVFIAIAYGAYLKYAIIATFAGVVITGWIFLINWTRRSISKTTTVLAIDQTARSKAELERRVVAMTESYILYEDHDGSLQFRGTVQVTENRHYPAKIEAPKDYKDTILMYHDTGASGRSIEKWINADRPAGEKKISYHEIGKVLDLYRKGWRDTHKKVIDAEEYPVDE